MNAAPVCGGARFRGGFCWLDFGFLGRATYCVRDETNQGGADIRAPILGAIIRRMTAMPHLLIVDDDDDILSLLTSFFKKHSHTVTVAANGAAMFAALERHAIDLVILDVMLQREDGFSLCRK